MVTPQLLSIHSPDLGVGESPADPKNCRLLVQATIGPAGTGQGEVFDFVVVTPQALPAAGLPRWGRGVLLMEEFSWATVDRHLQRLLARVSRPSWSEVASELNKELLWEFDSYQPHK